MTFKLTFVGVTCVIVSAIIALGAAQFRSQSLFATRGVCLEHRRTTYLQSEERWFRGLMGAESLQPHSIARYFAARKKVFKQRALDLTALHRMSCP